MHKTKAVATRSQTIGNLKSICFCSHERKEVSGFAVYRIYGFGGKQIDFGLGRVLTQSESHLWIEAPVRLKPGRQVWLSYIPEEEVVVIKAQVIEIKAGDKNLFCIKLEILFKIDKKI
ncbi:MAG: hypothetical protein EHM45_16635 [Desulfobacteraceae bacterium]|nr:MAG: hypothetical protein EHM45_16635 [Desulfobacteraceae bacterium]